MGEKVGVSDEVSVNKIPADEAEGDDEDGTGLHTGTYGVLLLLITLSLMGLWKVIELFISFV